MGGWAHELGWVWAKRLAGRILDCTGCIWSGLGVWGKHRDVQGEWAVCTNIWVYGLGVLTKCWVYGICCGAGLGNIGNMEWDRGIYGTSGMHKVR